LELTASRLRVLVWHDPQKFLMSGPGISVCAAQRLVDGQVRV
jgi:hypothetical protein